jgi:hypothetical protein
MRRRWRWVLGAVGVAVVVVVGVMLHGMRARANVGAGYVAHQICSCVFVSERSHAACRDDLLPVMAPVESEIVDEPGRHGVRAGVTGLASRVAWHRPELGCMLD